jgi:hypothetical protein
VLFRIGRSAPTVTFVILPDELSAEPRPRLGRRLWRALVLSAVGLLLVVSCGGRIAVHAVPGIAAAMSAPELSTPVDDDIPLVRSEYAVYQLSGEESPGSAVTRTFPQSLLGPGQVRVTGDRGRGAPVAVRDPGPVAQTLTRDGAVYTAVALFSAPRPGTYKVEVDSTEPASVVVTRSIGSAFSGMAPWLGGGLLGLLILLAGLLMLAVGAVRGFDPRPLRDLPPPVGPAPPGWYGDPLRPGRSRWWDGDLWSDRTL